MTIAATLTDRKGVRVFPLRTRGRATGWVAACTSGGGVMAQALFGSEPAGSICGKCTTSRLNV